MQDRYVGDIGDFVKYGLLRRLSRQKQLGVAWYLCPDEDHNSHGQYISYLEKSDEWESLDPELFRGLRGIVAGGQRSVSAIEASGLLPGAVFANEILDADTRSNAECGKWRHGWFERVGETLTGCDIVFADPDNGLVLKEKFGHYKREDWKRLPLDEAVKLSEGRTAVIYHHNTRRLGGHHKEIQYWMNSLPGCAYAFYWRRYSNRTFFVVNPDSSVVDGLEEFAETWEQAGELIKR